MELMTDELCINIVTRSEAMIGNGKENGKKEVEATWIINTAEKSPAFDVQKEK